MLATCLARTMGKERGLKGGWRGRGRRCCAERKISIDKRMANDLRGAIMFEERGCE